MQHPYLCMNQYFILKTKLILHYISPNVQDSTVEALLTTISSHWPATLLVSCPGKQFIHSLLFFHFLYRPPLRTVTATNVGVKGTQML